MHEPTLSRKARIDTVLAGDVPDRVPCIPLIFYFAAVYAGVSVGAFSRSMKVYRRAMTRCFNEIGPWDAMYPLPITMDAPNYDIVWGAGVGMKPICPTDGDDDTQVFQFEEAGALFEESDYKKILDYPLPRGFPYIKLFEILVSRSSGRKAGPRFWAGYALPNIARLGANWLGEVIRWKLRGIPFFPGFSLEAPFDTISMARGIQDFSLDLYNRADDLEETVMKLARSYAVIARRICEVVRIPNFLLLVHRTSNDFISPDHYRRFVHPGVRYIAEYLDRHDIVMGLHNDGNWGLNLEHMTDLPENTYFQLDGYTDIFRARKVLGDRFVIMGDVPNSLLVMGSPAEVEDYCVRLIKEVGRNGRFILSSGCEVPPNAKPGNVRAMIMAAEKHGRYY